MFSIFKLWTWIDIGCSTWKTNSNRHSLFHAGFVANVYAWCMYCNADCENEEFWPYCHCCSSVVFKLIIEIDHSTSFENRKLFDIYYYSKLPKSELSASVLSFYQFSRKFPKLFSEWPLTTWTKGPFSKFQKNNNNGTEFIYYNGFSHARFV